MTTSWTLVERARDSRVHLDELLRRYWSPVYAYLRRSGWSRADAEDLTQGFLTEVVLRRDLIGRADPQRGRFRALLAAALRNYVIDAGRRRSCHEPPAGTRFLPADPDQLSAAEPAGEQPPLQAFDRQWATIVFDQALRRTQADCRGDGMARHWRAFEARVRDPLIHGATALAAEALAAELNARNAQEIYDMVGAVKRKLRAALREVVAETVPHGDVDRELAELRAALST